MDKERESSKQIDWHRELIQNNFLGKFKAKGQHKNSTSVKLFYRSTEEGRISMSEIKLGTPWNVRLEGEEPGNEAPGWCFFYAGEAAERKWGRDW